MLRTRPWVAGERDVQVVLEACGEAVRLVNLGRLGGRVRYPEPLAEKGPGQGLGRCGGFCSVSPLRHGIKVLICSGIPGKVAAVGVSCCWFGLLGANDLRGGVRVKMERPAGRTTLTRMASSRMLSVKVGRGVGSLRREPSLISVLGFEGPAT